MTTVRPPAVAGAFYPGDPGELGRTCDRLLAGAEAAPVDVDLRMLIVPHAGYMYSGAVAATAYRLLRGTGWASVVLLGPSHFERFADLASPGADSFATPLGAVAVDAGLVEAVASTPNGIAHSREHSLEVQVPFLQSVLRDFTILPLLTGDVEPDQVADALEPITAATLLVISSDLSHYLDYDTAQVKDERTATAITELRPDDIAWDDACGSTAVRAALVLARRRGWECRLLDLRNSGDTAGDHRRVVGYGAFALGPAVS